MNQKLWTLRPAPLAAVLAAAALTVGACGDDEEPEKVTIEATGSGKQVKFTAPSEVPAGAAEIEFTNSTQRETDAQLIRVEDATTNTEVDVVTELGKAIAGEGVQDWFKAAGGVGATKPGETKTVTQELEAGTYYVVGQDEPTPPLTKITVNLDGGAELEEPEAKVTAQEYSFSGEGLKAGQNEVLLDNAGGTWHHFIAAPLPEGSTIEDVKAFFAAEGGPPKGPPPVDPEAAVLSSTVLDPGVSQVANLELEPGKYAFLCFIADKQEGGPEHVAKGMVSEVTVEE